MRKKLFAGAGIAVLIIGVTAFALGHAFQGGHGGRGKDRARMMEHVSKELGLNAEQQTQVKALFEGMHTSEEARHTKRDELRKQLDEATKDGQFDEARVRAIATEQANLMADSVVEHERMKSKIYAILTPEQRVKAEELHKRGGPGGRRHGPGMGGPH
ncbi:MAG TPA: Spy/CpxP family protein refolding chaperone [Pyrinomonadaceae bacterium]|nr:Spy/CpxP family protein refolding chaperone [Pyrinomonadaceae bacterium]